MSENEALQDKPATFKGFPGGALKATAIPNLFFGAVLPEIDSLDELKITLAAFRRIQEKPGSAKFVTLTELIRDGHSLNLDIQGQSIECAVKTAIGKAVRRGVFLNLIIHLPARTEEIYLLNAPQGLRTARMLREGKLDLGQDFVEKPEPTPRPASKSIFALYEENIGLLTPLIAEQLEEAEKLYPRQWIEDAFRQAVELNKRNWRYVQRILERWAYEGKSNERKRRW